MGASYSKPEPEPEPETEDPDSESEEEYTEDTLDSQFLSWSWFIWFKMMEHGLGRSKGMYDRPQRHEL